MKKISHFTGVILIVALLSDFGFGRMVFAATSNSNIKNAVEELNASVKDKRNRISEIDNLISGYRNKIAQQEAQQANLANETLLLENRIKEKELAILRVKTEIEALKLEIESLGHQISEQERRIAKQKLLIAELIRRVRQSDEVNTLDVFLTRPTLSSFFDRLEEVKKLERSLGETIEQVKDVKKVLEETKKARDDRLENIKLQEKELAIDQQKLEYEKNFKLSLITQTQQSQQEFEKILYELKQQQQTTQDDIARLEDKLKETLKLVDEALARGDILLNWPVQPLRGISARFRDPDYPFRNLFEHPGTDIPTPVGTPVRAAAGGYVAWNKIGRMYGYYTMIVHPGGIATIYAHMSKFIAKPDTYVERGDVIGLSGGRPGDPGAGLSTGPHLHFEVRQEGIPVNAENFLPSF